MAKILFLTVGTGNKEKQEETLLEPLRMSMKEGIFDKFILLPSQVTSHSADKLKSEFGETVEIYPLPKTNLENNADECFKFFDSVIQNYKDEDITFDITRGTKMMSAALYSAGLRNGILSYRYITGDRGQQGQVISGTEKINKFNAAYAHYLALIDQSKTLFQHGQFEAVLQILPEKKAPKELQRLVRYIRLLAEFYAAWDRLDYQKAQEMYPDWGDSLPEQMHGFERYKATSEMKEWIDYLCCEFKDISKEDLKNNIFPTEEESKTKGQIARYIAFDLWANGKRRVKQGQYEDAIIRSYRILEMLSQIALFDRGYNTEAINLSIQEKDEFNRYINGGEGGNPLPDNKHTLARYKGTLFLSFLEHKEKSDLNLGESLREIGKTIISDEQRNTSVLIHGYKIRGSKNKEDLAQQFEILLKYLSALTPQSEEFKKCALTINCFGE